MKQQVQVGQVDYTVLVLIRDDAGAPATGLTEASIDIAYARVETDNDVTTADVTPAALASLTAAHADWGFEEVSATDHPGLYRLDIADAVFASGAWSAVVSVVGTGLDPCQIEFVLVNHNPFSAIADILTDTGTTLQGELDGIQADTEDIQSRLPAALVNSRMDSTIDGTGMEAGAVTAVQSGLATAAELAKVPKSDGTATWNATALASINAEADTALADYDPPTRTEATADKDEILTAVGDVPTNSELTTALAAADDAVLAAIAALENLSAAEVASELADALGTDTIAELAGDPGATPTIKGALMLLYMALRNARNTTAATDEISDSDGTTILTADVGDDGVTFSKSRYL